MTENTVCKPGTPNTEEIRKLLHDISMAYTESSPEDFGEYYNKVETCEQSSFDVEHTSSHAKIRVTVELIDTPDDVEPVKSKDRCDVGAYLWGQSGMNSKDLRELGSFGITLTGAGWICTTAFAHVFLWPSKAWNKIVADPSTVDSKNGWYFVTRQALRAARIPKGVWRDGPLGYIDSEERLVFLVTDGGDTDHVQVVWFNNYVE
jgi:hypothetical protein